MTRVPLLLLSLLTAGGLASAALAKEGNKPPPGAAQAQFGNQPGLNGGDMNVRPVDRENHLTGEVQEGTGIRHGERRPNAEVLGEAGTRRPGAGQTQIAGEVQEGTGIRHGERRPNAEVLGEAGTHRPDAGQTQIAGEVFEGTGIRRRQPDHPPRAGPRRRRR